MKTVKEYLQKLFPTQWFEIMKVFIRENPHDWDALASDLEKLL